MFSIGDMSVNHPLMQNGHVLAIILNQSVTLGTRVLVTNEPQVRSLVVMVYRQTCLHGFLAASLSPPSSSRALQLAATLDHLDVFRLEC